MSSAILYPLEQVVERIEDSERRLGHLLGWRLLMDRQSTYAADTQYAFMTLNPGGNEDTPDKRLSSEDGNAYWVESWRGQPEGRAPLQQQVQELFREIVSVVGYEGSPREFAEARVCSAYFVPFRSPSVPALREPQKSREFARRLWTDILGAWAPRVILTIGVDAFDAIQGILGVIGRPATPLCFDTGYKQAQGKWARIIPYSFSDRPPAKLAGLPHLSRFRLFTGPLADQRRPKLRAFLKEAFAS